MKVVTIKKPVSAIRVALLTGFDGGVSSMVEPEPDKFPVTGSIPVRHPLTNTFPAINKRSAVLVTPRSTSKRRAPLRQNPSRFSVRVCVSRKKGKEIRECVRVQVVRECS